VFFAYFAALKTKTGHAVPLNKVLLYKSATPLKLKLAAKAGQ